MNIQIGGSTLKTGDVFAGRYQILAHFDSDEFGARVVALDRSLGDQTVLLRLFAPQISADKEMSAEFKQAIANVRLLAHPGLTSVFDAAQGPDGLCYIAARCVQGRTLGEYLQEMPAAKKQLPAILGMLCECADVLAYAHTEGLVHGFLRPSWIWISDRDGRVHISDLGLWPVFCPLIKNSSSDAKKPSFYTAPEVLRGEEPDERTDVYAFGIIARELLWGSVVSKEEKQGEVGADEVLAETEWQLPESQDVPQWLRELVSGCIAKRPGRRVKTIAEIQSVFAENMPDYQQKLQRAGALASLARGRAFNSRKSRLLFSLLGALWVLLAGAVAWSFQGLFELKTDLRRIQSECKEGQAGGGDNQELSLSQRQLIEAVKSGDARRVRDLLIQRLNPNVKDEDGESIIFSAIDSGSDVMVGLLLNHGVDVDESDDEARTLLMRAIRGGRVEVTEELLRRGADVNLADREGTTSLMEAVALNDVSTVQLLADKTPAFDVQDVRGRTALHRAAAQGSAQIAGLLLEYGANPDIQDNEGATALMLAVKRGDDEVVRELLKYKARTDLRDAKDFTVFDYAQTETKKLLSYGTEAQ